jgi:hypothetical protein
MYGEATYHHGFGVVVLPRDDDVRVSIDHSRTWAVLHLGNGRPTWRAVTAWPAVGGRSSRRRCMADRLLVAVRPL